MKSTKADGSLRDIEDCYLYIPNHGMIIVNNLPDISDTKQANYNEDAVIGRSSPLHTYMSSGTRQISINFHFVIAKEGDAEMNLDHLRAIESCVYARAATDNHIFVPPVICKLKCGELLAKDEPLCVVLQNYNVTFPTEVAWDKKTLCPYKFDVSTSWWVVYVSADLPHSNRIIYTGR